MYGNQFRKSSFQNNNSNGSKEKRDSDDFRGSPYKEKEPRARAGSFNEDRRKYYDHGEHRKRKPPKKTLLNDAYIQNNINILYIIRWTFYYVFKSPIKGKKPDYSHSLRRIFTTDCVSNK